MKVIGFTKSAGRSGVGVDCNACLTRTKHRGCKCGKCAICGYAKHTGIHSACEDGKPWGHEFKEDAK